MKAKATNFQYGDTIVEVLIAIAIIGSVLVVANGSARRSLNSVQSSKERHVALAQAQTQLELARTVAATNPDAIKNLTGPFCAVVDPTDNRPSIEAFSATEVPPEDFNADNSADYPDICKFEDKQYRTAITYDHATDIARVRIRWDGLSSPVNQVELLYRLPFVVVAAPVAPTCTGSVDLPPIPSGERLAWQNRMRWPRVGGPEALPDVLLGGCAYNIVVTTSDSHSSQSDPYFRNQEGEQLRVDFLDSAGNVLVSTGYTTDLPDDQDTIQTSFNFTIPSGATATHFYLHHLPANEVSGQPTNWSCGPGISSCGGSIVFDGAQITKN